jgi:hypothetical protein
LKEIRDFGGEADEEVVEMGYHSGFDVRGVRERVAGFRHMMLWRSQCALSDVMEWCGRG